MSMLCLCVFAVTNMCGARDSQKRYGWCACVVPRYEEDMLSYSKVWRDGKDHSVPRGREREMSLVNLLVESVMQCRALHRNQCYTAIPVPIHGLYSDLIPYFTLYWSIGMGDGIGTFLHTLAVLSYLYVCMYLCIGVLYIIAWDVSFICFCLTCAVFFFSYFVVDRHSTKGRGLSSGSSQRTESPGRKERKNPHINF
jgi:hypothetical protein